MARRRAGIIFGILGALVSLAAHAGDINNPSFPLAIHNGDMCLFGQIGCGGSSSAIACSQLPAFTGDVTTAGASCSTTVLNLANVINSSLTNNGLATPPVGGACSGSQVTTSVSFTAIPSCTPMPFYIPFFFQGLPASSGAGSYEEYIAPVALNCPANFGILTPNNQGQSEGSASAASSSTATFTLTDVTASTTIGTMVFTSSATATFTTTSGTAKTIAKGDVLKLTAPGSQDATLADVVASFTCQR